MVIVCFMYKSNLRCSKTFCVAHSSYYLRSHCVCGKIATFKIFIVLKQLIGYFPRIYLHTA